MNRQVRRLQRAIDEILKIHDDGCGSEGTQRLLDALNDEIAKRED